MLLLIQSEEKNGEKNNIFSDQDGLKQRQNDDMLELQVVHCVVQCICSWVSLKFLYD